MHCSNCGDKLGMMSYAPKEQWQLSDKICGKCFSELNKNSQKEFFEKHKTMEKSSKFFDKPFVRVGLVITFVISLLLWFI